jgi:hypothetical protein
LVEKNKRRDKIHLQKEKFLEKKKKKSPKKRNYNQTKIVIIQSLKKKTSGKLVKKYKKLQKNKEWSKKYSNK